MRLTYILSCPISENDEEIFKKKSTLFYGRNVLKEKTSAQRAIINQFSNIKGNVLEPYLNY